ncbi:hypothetical protein AB1Y20_003072 [Prymnesium parvum]|uniref:Calpain catalytic domain-containing protein n=1 Tax=Prymnesium parvum TaxID=97485 RepID=A0AB34JAE7_PRYPA
MSGGCPKHASWPANPMFVLAPSAPCTFTIDLTQLPADGVNLVPIGFAVLLAQHGVPLRSPILAKQVMGKSKYKSVRTQSLKVDLQPVHTNRLFVVVPMTFEPGHLCDFELSVTTDPGLDFRFEPYSVAAAEPLATFNGAQARPAAAPPPRAVPSAPIKLPAAGADAPPALSNRAHEAAAADPELAAAIDHFQLQSKTSNSGFEDPAFALNASKGGSGRSSSSLLYLSGQPASDAPKVDSIWRLNQMGGKGDLLTFTPPTSMMVHRPTLNDVWLLSAIGMLCTRPDLLSHVLFHSEPSAGLHAMRFFKDGEWKTVVVDDMIPCHGKLKPIFSSNSEPRDGPVSILQKGLAKLYGCYEHLSTGRVGSALEDFTGGVSEKIYLRDGCTSVRGDLKQPGVSIASEVASGALWARLATLIKGSHLLGASFKPIYASRGGEAAMPVELEGNANGALIYPVLELREAQGQQFVRLRNPWRLVNGVQRAPEWRGAWSTSSPEWQSQPGLATSLGGRPRDGSFWMTFADFLHGFNKINVCRVFGAGWTVQRVHGAWTTEEAGGMLRAWPNSPWRRNPQYTVHASQRCTAVIGLSQQDAQTDANDASDIYPHAIGIFVLAGSEADGGDFKKVTAVEGEVVAASRLSFARQSSISIELEPTAGGYVIIPCTLEPFTFINFTVTVASTAPVAIARTPAATPGGVGWQEHKLRASWSVAKNTAGGCPNNEATWTNNPQFLINVVEAETRAVCVLCLDLDASESEAMLEEHEALTAEVVLAETEGRLEDAEAATRKAAALAPAMGFVVLRNPSGTALSGAFERAAPDVVAASKFLHGTQEVVAEVVFLEPGTYVLVASTFDASVEANFNIAFYSSSLPLTVSALNGGEVLAPGSGVSTRGGARPQGITPPSTAGSRALPRPLAKHDVGKVRSETEDDGKLGYEQRLELEEAARLEKWIENLPMMTIEGQPLSENVKKKKDALVAKALSYCERTGQKFEDSEFPSAPGTATGRQPQVYANGEPSANMPVVTQWLRPEEFIPLATDQHPIFYKNDYEADGLCQGGGLDNRWFISALNIVAANRIQLDRIFFGELDQTWIDNGFFVCKFYKDDPLSDDDWQVVLIDDRIPCDANGRPAFCHSQEPHVYWPMIIEKAYAKFCGSYEAMRGGTVTQGLEDLTGGVGYKFDLVKREKEWIPPKGETPDRLWDEMMEKMRTEHVVGCANNTKGQPRPQTTKKGIELNRAYAVVTGGQFEDYRLMRLRVPLNEFGVALEWNGKWADGSSAWNSRLRQMLHYSRDAEDGTFWMEYNDFCRHFNKVYMCRMLDDLWTRFTVKSRWMDETAGGCTNFISWRNNNQWLLNIHRPQTKLIIKLTQPDARKTAGNGRHYSNAIGFYILKGNEPNEAGDHKRRKLVLQDGDYEDGGDFVFVKEPRFTRQVITEYTFEEASDVPYILLPFMFEPGREALFKLTILSDDRDDDGIPDFGFQDVKPEDDWRRTTLNDSWSMGGSGNPLGTDKSAGGPVVAASPLLDNGEPEWCRNWQFQITLEQRSRCFVFLELLEVVTDMRTREGLQTEPDYKTVGFIVCKGRGNHIPLQGPTENLEVLATAELKKGDGVYLELGYLEPDEDRYVVIPYTDQPGVEHKYAITLYSDYDHVFEKINPRLNCEVCTNPNGIGRVQDQLETLSRLLKRISNKEQDLYYTGSNAPKQSGVAWAQDGEGVVTLAELEAYSRSLADYAQTAHAQYLAQLGKMEDRSAELREELEKALAEEKELEELLRSDSLYSEITEPTQTNHGGSRACVVQ